MIRSCSYKTHRTLNLAIASLDDAELVMGRFDNGRRQASNKESMLLPETFRRIRRHICVDIASVCFGELKGYMCAPIGRCSDIARFRSIDGKAVS